MARLGFLGLGNMGLGLALNLAKRQKGVPVAGYSLGFSKRMQKSLGSRNIQWTPPKKLAATSDILFTSLPGPREVEQVMVHSGVLDTLPSGAIWCDMTTTSPAAARAMKSAADERGVTMIEAPVTGGSDGAWAGPGRKGCRGGYAVLLVGGPSDVVNGNPHVRAALACLGEVCHVGENVPDGTAMKLLTNGVEYGHAALLSEALAVAQEYGFDLAPSIAAISNSSGGSYCAAHDGQAVRALDFDPSFPTSLAVKDLNCMKTLSEETNVPTPLLDHVKEKYCAASDTYGKESPWLSVVRQGLAVGGRDPVDILVPEKLPPIDFDGLWEEEFGFPSETTR